MTEVINLRTARKRAARSQAERSAAENRLAHGVAKVDRERAAADRENLQRNLEQHKLETGGRR
jgi:hypothetical protein